MMIELVLTHTIEISLQRYIRSYVMFGTGSDEANVLALMEKRRVLIE